DAFLHRFFVTDAHGSWRAVDSSDPGWLELVYSDRVLVTQLDDDPGGWEWIRSGGEVSGVATSSSSMPAIMAIMLHALRVDDDQPVVEIGAGTGYNAGLLCHRLGEQAVTPVDIDPDIATEAAANLATCDYRPAVAVADGADGYPANAPYDRILATCALARI